MNDDIEELRIATPAVTMETIAKVCRALYAFKKPASYKALAAPLGMHENNVSSALSSARDLGFVETSEKRGEYLLTDSGETFARFMDFGKDSESRQIVVNQIRSLPAWSEIISFLETNTGNPRSPDDLVLHVERRLGKRWKARMRAKVSAAYKSILEYATLVRVEDNMLISEISPGDAEEHLIPRSDSKTSMERPVESVGYSSMLSGTRTMPDYAEFSIPDFFILFVKKDLAAIEYLRKQLIDNSLFESWLDALESRVENEKEEVNQERDD